MEIAPFIDHTALKPQTTFKDVEKLCSEALEWGFASVCINPVFVKHTVKLLEGSKVLPCTVTGFPLGASAAQVKIYETEKALNDGAREIDTVINVGAAIEGDWKNIHKEISEIAAACKKSDAILKVILETCLLNRSQITEACKAVVDAGADFVKTSTGFSHSGAEVEIVSLMRQTVGESIGVKASGGIRTYEDALKMIDAGANRLGSSSGVKLLKP